MSNTEFGKEVEKLHQLEIKQKEDNFQRLVSQKYEEASNKITEEQSEYEDSPHHKKRQQMNMIIQPVKMFSRKNTSSSQSKFGRFQSTSMARSPTRIRINYAKLDSNVQSQQNDCPELDVPDSNLNSSFNDSKRQRLLARQFIRQKETKHEHPLKR